jgi:prepilin peptidase CpaA
METGWIFATACVVVFTAIGMVYDLRTRKLPNVLTVPAFCAGLLFHAAHGFYRAGLPGAGHELLFALGGFGTGFGIILLMWFLGGAGGGDVKLMGALGTWLGAWLTLQVLVLSSLLSGMLTFLILNKKIFGLKRLGGNLANESKNAGKKGNSQKARRLRTREGWVIPFGVTVALAAWIILAAKLAGYELPWSAIAG